MQNELRGIIESIQETVLINDEPSEFMQESEFFIFFLK